MFSATLDQHLHNLDLTHPADLLIAFHLTHHWPRTPPMDDVEGSRQLELIQHFAPMIFGVSDHDLTRAAIQAFLKELGGEKITRRADGALKSRPLAPREWQHVFREAFHRGVLTAYAFGIACRFLTVRTEGNGAPMHPKHSQAGRLVMLQDLREACPAGFMDEDEQRALAAAPEFVTLWRGGHSPCGDSIMDRAQGLFWAPEREYAEVYMRARGMQSVLATAGTNSLANLSLGIAGTRIEGMGTLGACNSLSEPFLLLAKVPRQLLLAFVVAGPVHDKFEVFIDYEKLTSDMVRDVTPRNVRESAARGRRHSVNGQFVVPR